MTGGRRPAVGMCAIAVVLAACGGGDADDQTDDARVVTVFAPYRGREADLFVASVERFTVETGIDVRYTGTSDFVVDLFERVEEIGTPPDVAIVPQPGVVDHFVASGAAIALDADTVAELTRNYEAEVGAVAVDDGQYAVPFRRTLKSIVWFRPDVFAEEGWEIPTTLDALEALSARVARSDREMAPWCFAIQAGDSTGWAATDWVEDLVVRRSGVDVYTDWAAGTVPFSDQRIAAAFDEFRSLVLDPGRVSGGIPDVVGTRVERAWGPLLDDEPGCAMYKQADFALDWMSSPAVGPDEALDWFVLPDELAGTAPLVVGGDQVIRFDDRADVSALMTFLAGPDAGMPWVDAGGFLSAKTSIGPDDYPPVERRFVDTIHDAEIRVFDASDQMNAEVGSDLLWDAITSWVAGSLTYEEFARVVDDARVEAD
jgi:alpha-glucoside transport system substrate-binding protein